jgi:hypothetical protein
MVCFPDKFTMSANGVNKPFTRRVRLNSTTMNAKEMIQEVDRVVLPDVGAVNVQVVKGDFSTLPIRVQQFIARYVSSTRLLLWGFFGGEMLCSFRIHAFFRHLNVVKCLMFATVIMSESNEAAFLGDL